MTKHKDETVRTNEGEVTVSDNVSRSVTPAPDQAEELARDWADGIATRIYRDGCFYGRSAELSKWASWIREGSGFEVETLAREIDDMLPVQGSRQVQIDAIAALLRSRLGEGRWIPVSERLPEENVWVLVLTTPNCYQHALKLSADYWVTETTDGIGAFLLRESVSHWRPLPAPPEETKK